MNREVIDKPWGREEIVYKSDDFTVLKLFLDEGEETSLHKHCDRTEVFAVLSGSGRLVLEGEERQFGEGDFLVVEKGREHRWYAGDDVEMIEVTSSPLEDSVRIDDKYGRD